MPLKYLVVCDVCATEEVHDDSDSLPSGMVTFRSVWLCQACESVSEQARQNIDDSTVAEIKRLRGLS